MSESALVSSRVLSTIYVVASTSPSPSPPPGLRLPFSFPPPPPLHRFLPSLCTLPCAVLSSSSSSEFHALGRRRLWSSGHHDLSSAFFLHPQESGATPAENGQVSLSKIVILFPPSYPTVFVCVCVCGTVCLCVERTQNMLITVRSNSVCLSCYGAE